MYSASIRRTRGADDDVLKNIEADIIQPGQKVETNKPDVVEVKKGISSVNAAEGGPASGGEAPAGGLGALGGLFSQLLGSVKDQAQKSVADDLAKVNFDFLEIELTTIYSRSESL